MVALGAASRALAGGAVAASEQDAARAGAETLAAGGNAVDAAVATVLALAVVHPEAGNLGGGGFAVVRTRGEVEVLDFREVAPAAAHERMFLDERGEPRPGASLVGPLAAGVPGSPAGYFELHRRYGRLPWPRVVAPAIALARDGFELSARGARNLAEARDELARFPESAAVWLPGGRPLAAGARVRLPDLARTLERYAALGPEAIVAGEVAAAIEAASRRHGGVLTAAELAAYRPVWREPLRFRRSGWEVATVPLPSSGGIVVGQALGLVELGDETSEAGRAHRLVEGFRRAFVDRTRLGDPERSPVRAVDLLAPAWLERLHAGISRDRATPSLSLVPYPGGGGAGGAVDQVVEPSETTHLSVVDSEGNLVALTTTLNDLFGCKLWVPGAGFFLNDEMDDFTTAPGRPNLYGIVQGDANRVAPGRRMLSSMTPLVAWRGEEALATGGRGGSRIPTAVVQVLLALWGGDPALAAVARPRIHHQGLPDRLEHEAGALDAAARADLERRGHALVPAPLDLLPKVNLVVRRAGGAVEAAGDPRGPEFAAIVP